MDTLEILTKTYKKQEPRIKHVTVRKFIVVDILTGRYFTSLLIETVFLSFSLFLIKLVGNSRSSFNVIFEAIFVFQLLGF